MQVVSFHSSLTKLDGLQEKKKRQPLTELLRCTVDIGPGPIVAKIIAALPGQLPIPPTIRIAESSEIHFRKSDRFVQHEGLAFGIPLKTSGQRLDIVSEGSVGIDDRSIDLTLSLPIPDSLPTDRPLFTALAGKTIKVSVEGTLDDPKLQLDTSLKQTAAEVATDFIRELRNKKSQIPPVETSEKLVFLKISNRRHHLVIPQKPMSQKTSKKRWEREETRSTQRPATY